MWRCSLARGRQILLLLPLAHFGALSASDAEQLVRRVHAHLAIGDADTAIEEARVALSLFPASSEVRKAYLRVLAEKGDEIDAFQQLRMVLAGQGDLRQERAILETVAWGALQKGARSEQISVRLNAMLGAVFTGDIRGVKVLLAEMRSTNSFMRSIAVQLAASMGDTPLREEVLRLIAQEKIWYVRIAAIEAAGKLQMREAQPYLAQILATDRGIAEEQAAAVAAIAMLYEYVSHEELQRLATAKRSGLRHLACELIAHFGLHEEAPLLEAMIRDPSPNVRTAAISGLGCMGVARTADISALVADSAPQVAITAAWCLLRQGEQIGEEALAKWIFANEGDEWRRMASAAAATCGRYGEPLLHRMLMDAKDPFVRVNAAIGLIGQRIEIEKSSRVIADALGDTGLWMWDSRRNPLFRSLAPSRLRHVEHVPNYPLLVDHLVRLDLLHVLSMLKYPKALDAVRAFLVSGKSILLHAAATTMLREGDEESMDALRALLKDEEEHVRTEAALALALWGHDPVGVDLLMVAYPHASRDTKVRILEALSRITDKKVIPFLVEALGEPFQLLRIVAASALIQNLYQ